jgi:hypothetical protein
MVHFQVVIVATAVVLTLVLVTVLWFLLKVVRRSKSPIARVLAVTASLIIVVVSPIVFDAGVTAMNPTRGMSRVFVDPGWGIKVAPATIGVIAVLLMYQRSRRQSATTE